MRKQTAPRSNAELGAFGERVAARYLVRRGMALIERNWRCRAGEIDLVLRDGRVLVICEVKTRRGVGCGHPLEAVTGAKAARLHDLAALWQEERQVRPAQVRLDAVGVLIGTGGRVIVEHARGVG